MSVSLFQPCRIKGDIGQSTDDDSAPLVHCVRLLSASFLLTGERNGKSGRAGAELKEITRLQRSTWWPVWCLVIAAQRVRQVSGRRTSLTGERREGSGIVYLEMECSLLWSWRWPRQFLCSVGSRQGRAGQCEGTGAQLCGSRSGPPSRVFLQQTL